MNHDYIHLFAVLALTLLAARLLGFLAQRLGQPAVLGELVAGVLLGRSLFGILDPADPVTGFLAEMGLVILLFAIGVETSLQKLARVGRSALAVGLTGVVLPFVLGYFVARGFGLSPVTAVVCGAALTATSIGISARILSDLGRLNTAEGQIVLGAAVIDDVVGLVILSIVSSLVAGTAITAGNVSYSVAIAVGFLAASLVVGLRLLPGLFGFIEERFRSDAVGPAAIVLALLMAAAAARAGSAAIIGAFAAGLLLHKTAQRHTVEKFATSLGHFFVPIFFASVGAAVDIRAAVDPGALAIGASLLVVGILGKFIAGFAPLGFAGSKPLVGIAMLPRGEVGLIFAQMGLASGALDTRLFGAITLMVIGTTLVAPPLLKRYGRPERGAGAENLPGSGGVDDLVA